MENAEWRAARADYEAGMKRRDICAKYGCSYNSLDNRIKREGWGKTRKIVKLAKTEKLTEKRAEMRAEKLASVIAGAEASNEKLAADIQSILLRKLKAIAEAIPEDTTETKISAAGITKTQRFRDLTAAYKDLVGEKPSGEQQTNELLQSLIDLERGRT